MFLISNKYKYKELGGTILLVCTIPILLIGKEGAYKDSLKGHNPYKIEVRTEYRDGKFYNSDTVFIKKKKKKNPIHDIPKLDDRIDLSDAQLIGRKNNGTTQEVYKCTRFPNDTIFIISYYFSWVEYANKYILDSIGTYKYIRQ